jgi:ankyrin repeat protein
VPFPTYSQPLLPGGLQRPLLELLLANGANVLAMDEAGETPLDLARRVKREDLVKLLERWPNKP